MIDPEDWENLEQIAGLLSEMYNKLTDEDLDSQDEVCLEADNMEAVISGFLCMYAELSDQKDEETASDRGPSELLH